MSLIPKTEPTLLCDVLFMKRNRGDADAETFEQVACDEMAMKLNATIRGTAFTIRQIIDSQQWAKPRQDRAKAFLRDLDEVIVGDRRGWIAPHEREEK